MLEIIICRLEISVIQIVTKNPSGLNTESYFSKFIIYFFYFIINKDRANQKINRELVEILI